MDIMLNIILFFVFMGLLVIAGSTIIVGFFASSRGRIQVNVDGTKEKKGLILRGWYFFWHREKRNRKYVQYVGPWLQDISAFFQQATGLPLTLGPSGPCQYANYLVVDQKFKGHIEMLERNHKVKINVKDDRTKSNDPEADKNTIEIYVHKDEPDYFFPAWVRDMTSGCITCHSSIYGSLIFWVTHALMYESVLHEIYSGFEYERLAIFFAWISYVFILAHRNTVLWNRHQALGK